MISQKILGQKIRELRDSKGLNQVDLAKKLEISRVALSEVERGNRGVDALELAKIASFFGIDMDYLMRDERPIDPKKDKKQDMDYKFNPEKLKAVILYILEKCAGKPNVGETVLYKLLYFIDFDGFEIIGRPITGLSYVRLQYGPVPMAKQYNQVVDNMVIHEEMQIISQRYFGHQQKRYINLITYVLGSLVPQEMAVIDDVINRLSSKTATEIENYVHEDAPWKLVEDKKIIPYHLVFERSVPFARSNSNQQWSNAAAQDTLKYLGDNISKEEYEYYSSLK